VWRKPFFLWPMLSLPFFYLLGLTVMGGLGADPAKELVHSTGEYALWLLMLVMLASPVQFILRRRQLSLIRRALGVACFAYVFLHVLLYIATYLEGSLQALIEDLIKRPYIFAGAFAFILGLAMALTSNDYSVRRLGIKWKSLHKSVYLMVVAVCVHIIWQVKFDYGEVILYSTFFALMFLLRRPSIRSRLVIKP